MTDVDQDDPAFLEIADMITASFVIWDDDNLAAAGCLDEAILLASESGDRELVNRLDRLRLDMKSGVNPDEHRGLDRDGLDWLRWTGHTE